MSARARTSRREELKSVRGVPSPTPTHITTTKRDELKDIRTSQASLSTNIHLLQRKSVALSELKPKTTRDSRNAIKELESYNEMIGRTIKQSDQINERLRDSYAKVREEKRNIDINRKLYTSESYNAYMSQYETYEDDIKSSIRNLSSLKRSLGDNKTVVDDNIVNIKDWMAQKGELSHEVQLKRMQRQTPRAGVGYTVKWIENGEEKTATFKSKDQLDNFIKRLQKRGEISHIRQTSTPSRVPPKGPLSGLENLTWKYQTLADLRRSRPKTEDEKKHPWSRIGKYDTSNPEDMKNAIGWASTQVVTGGVVAVPYILGGAVGAVTLGPWGAIFIPAAMASFALPKVTTIGQRDKFLKYIEEHPEFYTETAFRILGGLAVAKLGSSGIKRVNAGAVRRVKMTTKNYMKYLKSRPWSGQMASQQQMSWIDKLVSDMLDRVVPEYSHVPGPRTRNVGQDVSFQSTKLKDYYWKIPSSGALRGEEVVTVSLKMPRVEHPLWWAVISTPGGYEKIADSLRSRGLTDVEIDSILVSMGKSQEIFVSPLLRSMDQLKPLDLLKLRDLSLTEIKNMPILSPSVDDLSLLQDLIQEQEVIHDTILEQETILEQDTIQEPVLEVPPFPVLDLPVPPKLLETKTKTPKKGEEITKTHIPGLRKIPPKKPSYIKPLRFKTPQAFEFRFQYYATGERVTVRAHTWSEALRIAQSKRKIKGQVLEVEVTKI